MVKQAKSDIEIEKCYEVIAELRTYVQKDGFLKLVREMEKDGYCLGYIEDNNEVLAVAGFRVYTNLFMGKHLYVDDIVISSKQRSKGYGAELIEWLKMEAKKEKCAFFSLDSGIQRGDAHRFYFNHGLTIASYHFSEQLR